MTLAEQSAKLRCRGMSKAADGIGEAVSGVRKEEEEKILEWRSDAEPLRRAGCTYAASFLEMCAGIAEQRLSGGAREERQPEQELFWAAAKHAYARGDEKQLALMGEKVRETAALMYMAQMGKGAAAAV